MTLTLPSAVAEGHDWPQFRGIDRDGISRETGLSDSWPESGPKEVWRVPLGEGYSGISVVGNRLYTMYAGDHDGKPTEFAAAFDATTGKELWRTPIGEKHDTEFGNGPRSTPAVDGDTVFALGSKGDMAALSTEDGSERWRLRLTEAFGSEVPHWGFSTSALVDGDHVVVQSGGGDGKSFAALDKKTGETALTFGDGGPSYNSPLRVEINGEPRYVYVSRGKVLCVDAKGKKVWEHDWFEGRMEAWAIPVRVPPNKIFASGAEGVVAHMLEVTENGSEGSVEKVWESRFMRNHFNASVFHDGHLYGFDNATLKAMSTADGKLTWAKRGLGKGSLIFADGKLYVLSDRGQLVLLEATPQGYTEKGSVQALEGRCWTSPTLSKGRLYLRNHDEMVVYDVKG
jgi:outer membrane protein assembly factor BamB